MYFLFDIGGSFTRITLSQDGKSFPQPQIFTTPQNFDSAITLFQNTAQSLTSKSELKAAAGGVAGILDPSRSILVTAPHIKGWATKLFKEHLEKILQVPVFLENDAALAALGEAIYGAGRREHIVAYMTVSTGVGGARIVRGRIADKIIGFEPGHQIIEVSGKMCPAGDGYGHLEAYISGLALKSIYNKNPQDIDDPKVWDQVARLIAVGLHNLVVFWSPNIIVLGGSVMKSISLEKVSFYLKENLRVFPDVPEVVSAALGDSSAIYGALEYLKQNLA